jgi:uncharacterized secreted repeat protein (TIGR03808 family)
VLPGGGNQSRALQGAIDEAARRGMPLFIPPGRYMVSDLHLPDGAYVTGVPGATQLLFAGGKYMLHANGARHITLFGLTIAGAGNQLTGGTPGLVHLRDVSGLAIDGCTIADSLRSGLVLEYCAGHVGTCEITGCMDTGLFSLDATGLEITGNHIHRCGGNGVQVWRSGKGEDGTIIAHNRIHDIKALDGGSGQNGNGVVIFRAASVNVTGNRISDCATSAVRSNAGSNCQITGNSCERLGEVALHAQFGFEGAVIANNIVDTAAGGIAIANFDHGGRLAVCSGNVVRNLTIGEGEGAPDGRGTGISVEADTVLSNNVVEGAPGTGIRIGWGEALRDIAATGNVVRDAGIGIAVSVAPGAGKALVADNLISGTRDGAILGMKWRQVATGDLAREGAEPLPGIAIERNHAS